jgi:hypothetical protein
LNLHDTARCLHGLGHAPEFPTADSAFFEWVLKDLGQQLITRYQTYHGLACTGKMDAETEEHLESCRCHFPDRLALTVESCWALTSLRYFLQFTYKVLDPNELAAEYAEAIRRITAVCGVEINPTNDPAAAQIVAAGGPVDGPWNVLALTELPPPGAQLGTVLHQTFDIAEVNLTKEQRIGVMAHEACHFLGLGHAPAGVEALMAPGLGHICTPQPWDIAELQTRYGPPRTSPATPEGTKESTEHKVETIPLHIPESGPLQYVVTFDRPGNYLLVIVPLK